MPRTNYWPIIREAAQSLGVLETARILGMSPTVLARMLRMAPGWVQDEEIWERAKEAVSRSDYPDDDSYYAVVTKVYKNMGGGIKKGKK